MKTGLNMLFCIQQKCIMVQINLQPNYSTAIVTSHISAAWRRWYKNELHQNMRVTGVRHWSTLNPPMLCCIWAFNTALRRWKSTWFGAWQLSERLSELHPTHQHLLVVWFDVNPDTLSKIPPSHPQSPNWVQAQSHPPNLLLWHLL